MKTLTLLKRLSFRCLNAQISNLFFLFFFFGRFSENGTKDRMACRAKVAISGKRLGSHLIIGAN